MDYKKGDRVIYNNQHVGTKVGYYEKTEINLIEFDNDGPWHDGFEYKLSCGTNTKELNSKRLYYLDDGNLKHYKDEIKIIKDCSTCKKCSKNNATGDSCSDLSCNVTKTDNRGYIPIDHISKDEQYRVKDEIYYETVESVNDCHSKENREKCAGCFDGEDCCISDERKDERTICWIKIKTEIKKENKMKYKRIKTITLKSLIERDACVDALKYYINTYGKLDITFWAKKEDSVDSDWLKWLESEGFIELNIEKIVYDESKVYIVDDEYGVFKLHGIDDKYMFCELDDCSGGLSGFSNTGQGIIDRTIKRKHEIWVGNSTEDFYKEKFNK